MAKATTELTPLWTTTDAEASVAPPLVVGDLVLSFGFDVVIASDIYDGSTRWSHEVETSVTSAAVGDRQIYLLDGTKLFAINPTTAKEQQLGTLDFTGEVCARDGLLLVLDSTGALCRLDPANGGAVIWRTQQWQHTPGPIGLNADGTAAFFICNQKLYAVNTGSGDVRWVFAPDNPFGPQFQMLLDGGRRPLAIGGVVVAPGTYIYGVDQIKGTQSWVNQDDCRAGCSWTDPLLSSTGDLVVLGGSTDASRARLRGLDPATGVTRWNCSPDYPQLLDYTPLQLTMGNGEVWVTNAKVLRRIDTASGGVRAQYPGLGCPAGVGVGNGTVFAPTSTGIQAQDYGDSNALYFSGKNSRVDITMAGTATLPFAGDVTVEAWVRTNTGGELLSSHAVDPHGNRIRINITPEGRVRFAVVNQPKKQANLVQTAETNVADGRWHHVAVVRSADNASVIFVDGRAVRCATGPMNTPLAIGPQARLVVGAVQEKPFKPYTQELVGLMLDLRVWNRALTPALIQDRMGKELRGDEPGLIGYWRFDASNPADIKDVVSPSDHVTTLVNVEPQITDLELDQSLFPYLLSDQAVHWPYHGYWSVRGEYAMQTHAAATDGVVCYGTENELYGVSMLDGRRRWSLGAPKGTGQPVANGGTIYFADDHELHAVVAETGATRWMSDLPATGFSPRMDPPVPALDVSTVLIVDAAGNVAAYERGSGARRWVWPSGGSPAALCSVPNRTGPSPAVYCYDDHQLTALGVSGPQAGQPLWTLPITATGTMAMTQVCSAGGSVFFLDQGDTAIVAWNEQVWSSTDPSTRPQTATWRRNVGDFETPARAGARATGVTALSDANLVVVTTDYGVVYGLEYATGNCRWRVAIPAGSGPASGMIHPAVLAPHGVYCAAASGVVVALDAQTGALTGLFDIGERVLTCSVVEAGSVFFGCDDSDGRSVGALHSVVFGETTALRLGKMNAAGNPLPGPNTYLSVTSDDFDVLDLDDVRECCVEAWANTCSGGDIVSLCPAEGDRFGLRLWLEANGAINFHGIDKPSGGSWEGVHAKTAATTACDGRWHHIAVSRKSGTDIRIYLDGVAQTNLPLDIDHGDPSTLATKLQLFLGADATAPSVTGSFHGLLGEVRLWKTYLVASQITDRMHVKLRGDEPSLVAYWNFDTGGLHDEHGSLPDAILVGPDASFWLSDLVFTRPSYPYIMTEARLTQVGEEGLPPEDPEAWTHYSLDAMVHRADGTLLPNQTITLWYRQFQAHGDPPTIKIDGKDIPSAMALPGGETFDDAVCAQAMTDGNGHLHVDVATIRHDHGPMLHLNASYMPPNERYTVSVLINNQKLAPPPPPYLTARSSLVQDYKYTIGDRIQEDRDHSTYRTLVSARNADGTARSNERIEVWAREPVSIEVDGATSRIDAYTSQTFRTNVAGDLTLVVEALDIRTPELLLCAGFMHRNDRLVVAADHEAHTQLAAVEADDLVTPKATRWSPSGVPPQPLLPDGYGDHRYEIAGAISHVMSGTRGQQGGGGGGARLSTATGRLTARFVGDPFVPPAPPPSDASRTLRTLQHISRTTPVTPDAIQQTLPANMVGFKISCTIDPNTGVGNPSTYALQYLNAQQAAELHASFPLQAATPMLGGFFDDLWDAVVDVVDTVAEAIKSVAITIANTVTVAIEYVNKTVVTVINSVKEALAVIGEFFRQIGLAIMKVIEFLRFLFDWGAILKTHAILRDTINNMLDAMQQVLKQQLPQLKTTLHAPFEDLRALLRSSPLHPGAVTIAGNQRQGPGAIDQTNGVKGRMLQDKATQHSSNADFGAGADPADPADPPSTFDQIEDRLSAALGDILSMATNITNFNIGSLLTALGDLLDAILLAGEGMIDMLLDFLADAFELLKAGFNQEFHIPFLSELYSFITQGSKLTFLDINALILAVPMNLVYGLITGNHFGDDFEQMPAQVGAMFTVPAPHLAAAAAGAPDLAYAGMAAAPAPAPARAVDLAPLGVTDPDDARKWNIGYIVARSVYGVAYAASDALRMERPSGDQPAGWELLANFSMSFSGLLQGIFIYRGTSDNKWAGISPEAVWIGSSIQTGRALWALKKIRWNSRGVTDKVDKLIMLGQFAVGILVLGNAAYGRDNHPDEIDGSETAETIISIFPEVYRPVTVGRRPRVGRWPHPLVVGVALATIACGATACALHAERKL